MDIIFLYGPPASGKLTIGEKIAEQTGYVLFHNHWTVDLAKEFYEWGTPEYYTFLRSTRIHVLEHALDNGVEGVILTNCYRGAPDQDEYLKRMFSFADKVVCVQLEISPETMYARLDNDSRKERGKITTREPIDEMLKKGDYFQSLTFRDSLKINTEEVSVQQAAQMIIRKLH